MLENAITPTQPLRLTKHQDNQNFTRIGRVLCYDHHCTLLLSVTTTCNAQFSLSSSRSSRKAHRTELGSSDFELDSPSEVTSDHGEFRIPSLNSISNTLMTSSTSILKSEDLASNAHTRFDPIEESTSRSHSSEKHSSPISSIDRELTFAKELLNELSTHRKSTLVSFEEEIIPF